MLARARFSDAYGDINQQHKAIEIRGSRRTAGIVSFLPGSQSFIVLEFSESSKR
jgi:hypothetical protein